MFNELTMYLPIILFWEKTWIKHWSCPDFQKDTLTLQTSYYPTKVLNIFVKWSFWPIPWPGLWTRTTCTWNMNFTMNNQFKSDTCHLFSLLINYFIPFHHLPPKQSSKKSCWHLSSEPIIFPKRNKVGIRFLF